MKHGFVTAMEDILDADKKTSHEKLATQVCKYMVAIMTVFGCTFYVLAMTEENNQKSSNHYIFYSKFSD